ncbi:unnamed protein product [Musa banksii]
MPYVHLQATHIRLRKASNKTVLDVSLPTKLCSLVSQLMRKEGGEHWKWKKEVRGEKWASKAEKKCNDEDALSLCLTGLNFGEKNRASRNISSLNLW